MSGLTLVPHAPRMLTKLTDFYGIMACTICILPKKLTGKVNRSGYLLFAMVDDDDARFVDVRLHHEPPEELQWVRQDLLDVVSANWPEVIDAHVLHGVTGDTITDTEKKELRRKSVNYAPKLAEAAVMPLGGGMTSDGSSPAMHCGGHLSYCMRLETTKHTFRANRLS